MSLYLEPAHLVPKPCHVNTIVASADDHEDWFVTDDSLLVDPEDDAPTSSVGISISKLVGFGAAFATLVTVTATLL